VSVVREAGAEGERSAGVRDTYLWHSQAHMPSVRRAEIVLARGAGAYVWDEAGRRLLDAPASLWYCNVGHGRAEIADAVAEQMRVLEAYSTFQRYATRPALDVARRLAALVPLDEPRVFLTSGGGDSIDGAAKLARRYWSAVGRPEKRTVVTRELAYHGLHGFGTSITGLGLNRDGLGGLIPDTVRVPTHDVEAFERLVAEEGDSIAAFFCEPVIGTGGVVNPQPGYLEGVQRICKENDVLFVVDEVITGFGRTGAMFASERFGLDPDVLVLAKGVTSGYLPLGAMVAAERVWAPFWKEGSDLVFRHGVTYAGHATVCAAAMANLDILEREGLVERVRALEPLLDRLVQGLAAHELVKEVRSGVGLLAGIQLVDPATAERVAARCIENGVLMRVITDGTLQISPPFVVDDADLHFLVETIGDALDA
jgi:adenosylmethionine-8-amino-7-oxononanoate aminotransferase